MATFKFIIRKNKSSINKDGTTLLFLRYTHKGKTSYFTTKKRIPVNSWDQDGQRVKRSYNGHSTLNMYLSKFRQQIENIVNKALFDSIEPTTNFVRNKYDSENSREGKEKKQEIDLSFEQFALQFIKESKRTKKPSTIRSYNDFINILDLYKKSRKRRKLVWESFNMDWYYDFMDFYVYERGANNNTFGKMIKTLKTFLNAATDQGCNSNLEFRNKRFKVYQEEVTNIYLNEKEIQKLLDIDLSNNLKRQTIRDLFVIGCYTGLRFGDFKQINQKNISNDRLKIKTQKTGKYVVIPFHPIVKDIINKYDGKLPRSYCNNIINTELKALGRLAKFNENVIQVRMHGTERKETKYKKWQLISTHCARRSFATNLFKQGFPAISIMKITGHKSEKTFMRYIKVTEDEVATMLEEHWSDNLKKAV
ncbi:tyrosine-type recombinase/integrase [uncultured Marixanthomonas sp.]|uniref:site-specific integrase n=1 Tax=uncultured Marixanthomonas sp. TaxID=757245 RepID=UPI0030DADE94|tara:strand:- start:252217 stop:253479 length:1263 start_codon:yes stop_codon:yes gene_type:complete